jgi:prepilin-type processing-associated H-X9-DG protein
MGSMMLVIDQGPSPSGEPRPKAEMLHSWMTEILPGTGFVVGGRLRQDLPWNDPRNSAYFKGVVPIYLNPEVGVIRSPEGYALSHYAGNVHVLGRDRAVRRVGPGEAANTILAGEVADGFKPWGDATNLRDPGLGVNTVPEGFGGPTGAGANFLFVDGSVRFLRDTTSHEVLRRLSVPRPPDR